VFVRLTGCPLRCHYCDSAYAFQGGELHTLENIVAQVKAFDSRYVCVTGGEPLAQKNCIPLLQQLCDEGMKVSLETSGALAIDTVDARVKRVVDLKTPSSGEQDKNLYSNIEQLTASDEIKFVIGSREDYLWVKDTLKEYQLDNVVNEILVSPAFAVETNSSAMDITSLANWVVEDKLPVRMQLQMHKFIWGDKPGY
jgi:7-carboxy-7-deazaguanine synthase